VGVGCSVEARVLRVLEGVEGLGRQNGERARDGEAKENLKDRINKKEKKERSRKEEEGQQD
jgi:hypothetical protein